MLFLRVNIEFRMLLVLSNIFNFRIKKKMHFETVRKSGSSCTWGFVHLSTMANRVAGAKCNEDAKNKVLPLSVLPYAPSLFTQFIYVYLYVYTTQSFHLFAYLHIHSVYLRCHTLTCQWIRKYEAYTP